MFIIGDHFDSDIYRAFGFHICHITYLLISFYLYLICIFAYESNAFRFNVSRIAEWEENALLVGRKLLDDNISHLYSYDTSVTTDHDDYLSNALEVSVVNLSIELHIWADNVWRGYPHGSYHPLQVRIIQPLNINRIPYP